MAVDLFSVPIFLICFREVLEASIIISVLLALVEQIVEHAPAGKALLTSIGRMSAFDGAAETGDDATLARAGNSVGKPTKAMRLIRRLRIQIFAGSFAGLFVALCIGASFLAIWYTKVTNLYENAEDLWEGIFCLIAATLIFVMGLTMLRMDRAKVKWRLKLAAAFEAEATPLQEATAGKEYSSWWRTAFNPSKRGRSSRYMLFFLPFVTVLREGLEAVIFIGGVSLGQPATSIPIAAMIGILCGLLVGYVIYHSSSRLNLSIFLVVSTAFLMFVGAGLLSKAAWYLTMWPYVRKAGEQAVEKGDGPGSFPLGGVIYHINYANPENKQTAGGWMIFAGIFGWNNTMTIATLLCYIGHWLAVTVALIFMKWQEGRCTLFGMSSAARDAHLARCAKARGQEDMDLGKSSSQDAGSVGASLHQVGA